MARDMSGRVTADERLVPKTKASVHSDDVVQEMLSSISSNVVEPLDALDFVVFYSKSSPLIKQALVK